MQPNILIELNGGLGNQLFQFGAYKYLVKRGLTVEFTADLGVLTKNENDIPQIFEVIDNMHFRMVGLDLNRIQKFVMTKMHNLCLRYRNSQILRNLLNSLSTLMFSARLIPAQLRAIGDTCSLQCIDSIRSKTVLVGYFQNLKIVDGTDLRESLRSFFSSQIDQLESMETPDKKILILQIRLGDYTFEKSFVPTSATYFSSTINRALKENKTDEIWLFSDEIDLAVMMLEQLVQERTIPNVLNKVRVIREDNLVKVLAQMSLGTVFVISNSTFGWWGAFLTVNPEAKVYAPFPWHRYSENDLYLYPSKWIQVNR